MSRGLNVEPNTNDLRMNEHQEMGNCTNEESNMSDSEFNQHKKLVLKLLKLGTYKVRGPNGELSCPFCVGDEKWEYHHLLEHAVREAEGSTVSPKSRASHSAMAKHLVIDLANDVEQIPHFSANKFLNDFVNEEKKLLDRVLSEDEEKTKLIRRMIEENDGIQHTIFQEARELLCLARDQSKEVLEQQEALSLEFEYKKRRLNSWNEELDKREASLTEEKREKDLRNNEMGEKLREAEENYRRLVERLEEKEVAFSNLEDVHQRIVLKEQKINEELQQVRLELIKLMSDLPSSRQVDYGAKRIEESYELWNFSHNRKATLTEVICYINGRTCAGPAKFDATLQL